MSELLVTSIYNQEGEGAPSFPKGATVTGVITATSFSGSGANLTGIDATALKDDGGVVKIQANSTGAVVTGILTVSSSVSVGGTLTYEDVTNIDSVGLITARSGVKVNAGGVDIAGGGINAVGVVTATSFEGSGANLTGIDALPSVSGTASGAITAGRGVQLKTDGTYEQITGGAQSFGTESAGPSGGASYAYMCAAFGDGKPVGLFLNGNNNTWMSYIVGTVSGTDVSWGAPGSVENVNTSGHMDIGYVPWRNAFIFACRNAGSGMRLERGTISGTTMTWDNPTNTSGWGATLSEYHSIAANPDDELIGIVYKSQSGPITLTEWHMSTTGAISGIGDLVFGNNASYHTTLVYDTTSDAYIAIWCAGYNSNYGAIARIPSSGGSGSAGPASSEQYFTSENCTDIKTVYDPDSNQTIVFYKGGGILKSITTKWIGTSFTFGDIVTVGDNVSGITDYSIGVSYDSNLKKVVYMYGNATKCYVRAAAISGSSILLDPQTEIPGEGRTDSAAIVYDTTNNKIVLAYEDWADSSNLKGRTFAPPYTNANADTFVGLSNDTVTNGQTVKVNTVSSISTQSGLTTATKYYVQGVDGGLGTTADSSTGNIFAGMALNSTQLLIKSA